jgi:hypothetical protein
MLVVPQVAVGMLCSLQRNVIGEGSYWYSGRQEELASQM